MFIVLYGINNLGKTTQAKLLVERLEREGHPAEYIKYPLYDLPPSGPLLNNYLRGGNPHGLSPREAQLLYSLNRTQYESVLKAKLANGTTIVAEDYVGTGIAWGIGAGVDKKFLEAINAHLIQEDLAFLFQGERFRDATEAGHAHETNEALMAKVKEAHEILGAEYHWRPVNAGNSIVDIHEELWAVVQQNMQ